MTQISDVCGGGDAGRALVPASLRGYRTWRLLSRRAAAQLPDGALPLTSVTRRNVRWEQTLTARCEAPGPGTLGPAPSATDAGHRAPEAGCVCGIYGWYDPADTYMTSARVFGVVEASGLVIMGEQGFRAQRATIAAVVTRSRRATAACERAGVAVYRRRRDLLRDYPPDDVSSLLGDPPAPAAAAAVPAPGNFDYFVLCTIWARSAVIAGALVALPSNTALVAAAAAQAAATGLVVRRLRH
jgi:hypothetical protein